MKKHLSILLFIFALCLTSSLEAQSKKATHHFAIENGSFMYDGKPIQIHSGEMHFARIPAPYWRHRLKMMKAMGLNAVATYVFWNYHETAPGVWNWQTGNHNIRRFIQTAAEEGMMVILRPGPYCCAEWEYGGYPWWLQNEKSLVVRTVNQPFQDSCRVYLNQLGAQLRDLQITHGGPIVMVQAENEFGSYVAQRKDIPLATHKAYSASIRQMLLDAGFDIPMFTSDGSWLFEGGTIEGALPTANGEDNVEKLQQVVNQYHGGQGPYMVAEYYPGWLDHWNEPFQKVKTESVVAQLEKYLKSNVNFNIYMVHGGTNFGFTSGANYSNATNIQPDLTSYDYDAPISEAGWATPKYMAIRNLLKKYTSRTLPAVPKAIPVVAIPLIKMTPVANLFDIIARMKPVTSDRPMTFEQLNQGFGYVLYRKHFNLSVHGLLKVNGLADYALVYVNGVKKGELNRLIDKDSLLIDIPTDANLDIFVENLGRINYGARITDNQKGITGTVVLNGNEMIGDWQMYGLPMSTAPRAISKSATYKKGQPIVYRGTFRVRHIGDTFLDMSRWGKGIVFVNGVNLGRYWKVGPQQTLYLPGCFLHRGKNSIVVFEQQNDVRQSTLTGIKTPILDRLVK
jgi:beta-galactosidase